MSAPCRVPASIRRLLGDPVSTRAAHGTVSGAVRTLSLVELNRATLARQLLLRRHRLGVLRAIERVACLQGQWPPAPYVGLWARLAGFHRRRLESALVRRDVVKATLMRSTLHLITARDYPAFSSALHDPASPVNPRGMAFAEEVAPRLRDFFGGESRSRREVLDWLARQHGHDAEADEPWFAWYAIRARAHIVHAPESAAWRPPSSPRFIALPAVVLPDVDEARVELVRRYLAAFGPATRADFADWSGLRVRDFAPALDALEPLRRFRDEDGRELLDIPRAPLPPADAPSPARLLPKWDSILLGHADRRRVMTDDHRRIVIGKNGDVAQTFLVDGMVAGTWFVANGRVALEPFAPLPRTARRDVAEEARRLEAFLRVASEESVPGRAPPAERRRSGRP
jgi:Winged helix DNA-binding domain